MENRESVCATDGRATGAVHPHRFAVIAKVIRANRTSGNICYFVCARCRSCQKEYAAALTTTNAVKGRTK